MPAKKKPEKTSSAKVTKKASSSKLDQDAVSSDDPIDALRKEGIIATFAQSAKKIHRNVRDIHVTNLSVTFHGTPIIEEAELSLNYGNRFIKLSVNIDN